MTGVGVMVVPLAGPLSWMSWWYWSINCALVQPIPSLVPNITCALLIITSLVVQGLVSPALDGDSLVNAYGGA